MATVHFGRLVGPAGFARPVAIKRLHRQFADSPEFVNMFLDEARLAACVAHPNVVQTLDIVSSSGEVFVVMQYVHGATLAQLARVANKKGERIPVLVALGVVCGILHGLQAAHEARNNLGERLDLIHRDVSPHNVLVGPEGVARLLDFGIAKATGRLQITREGQLKGKLAYMAPEQALGEAVTARTDIFAASVVLWEVLTGARLFHAPSEAEVLSRVLAARVPAPSSVQPDLPASLDRIVLKGLERDPSKRYSSAREMARELAGCIGTASPTEIGDWVERTAGEQLRERESRIVAIERSAVQPAPQPVSPASDCSAGRGDSLTPSGGAFAWGATEGEGPGVLAREARSTTQMSRSFVFALTGALAAIIAAGASSFHAARAEGHALESALTAAAHPVLGSEPGFESVAAAEMFDRPDDWRTPSGRGPAPAHAEMDSVPKARYRPTLVPANGAEIGPSGQAASSCDPPYTTDARGHVHFKPNCV
jgi:serine/threonine-protein kinase